MDSFILLCCLLQLFRNAAAVIGVESPSMAVGDGAGEMLASSQPPPPPSALTLTPSTPSITHFVNDSFIIFCKTVQKDIDTKWRDPRGQTRENTKGRVHIEKKTGLLALVFEHISLDDKGNWTCEMDPAAAAREPTKSFELLVNQKISFDKTELVQSVREGRDALVNCYVKGQPAPEVSWLHNGEYINTVNSTKHRRLSDGLFIRNVSQTDAGEYTCRAMRITPTFSDSDQITILLRIQHKPHWSYNETLPMQYAYVGGAVNLSCDAMGEPPPSFTWLHNSKGIVGFNHRIFMADYGATLQLDIRNASQFGDYKCKVANPLGMLERIIKLRTGIKPIGPTRIQLKRLYPDALELDLRSPRMTNATDEMQIFGYRVAYMSESDFKYSAGNWSHAKQRDFSFHRGHRFIVPHLKSNTTYLMRVASRNLAGLSDWSTVRKFATATASSWKAISWQLLMISFIGLALMWY
ncbi:neural cell adhesion molecule 2 isoform X1 [Drosophila albomicans]|uniref:Neural cell adhesion molecule 2 isoform X1 n=1 Tax=Drosophila albomicans TaxID=7291 RepID=A0A6P8W996_DROAB|nr:neural cell adhesion molecule 2 isoform X1 [Drosophila albomicans]